MVPFAVMSVLIALIFTNAVQLVSTNAYEGSHLFLYVFLPAGQADRPIECHAHFQGEQRTCLSDRIHGCES